MNILQLFQNEITSVSFLSNTRITHFNGVDVGWNKSFIFIPNNKVCFYFLPLNQAGNLFETISKNFIGPPQSLPNHRIRSKKTTKYSVYRLSFFYVYRLYWSMSYSIWEFVQWWQRNYR